ncbi:hypothetical protein [Stratiformator vulcanicus]|uniref:Uncharacterized protein n=1 Tax=Stratiformator vulcanicus TaxID=2527980 RepID=A0A517QZI7_9PLAN|nr:hypothetical protein [Stratiformator vulcanicus]QDT36960.1 hypothetical protein Pan189_13240 [Stratiformator vulcanicus]
MSSDEAITTTAVVGDDGILRVELDVGKERAKERLRLTVATESGPRNWDEEEYQNFVDRIVGCIDDDSFRRPEFPDYQPVAPLD